MKIPLSIWRFFSLSYIFRENLREYVLRKKKEVNESMSMSLSAKGSAICQQDRKLFIWKTWHEVWTLKSLNHKLRKKNWRNLWTICRFLIIEIWETNSYLFVGAFDTQLFAGFWWLFETLDLTPEFSWKHLVMTVFWWNLLKYLISSHRRWHCNLSRPRNNQEDIILRTLNSLTFTVTCCCCYVFG